MTWATSNDLHPPDHLGMKGHGIGAGSAVNLSGGVDLVAESESVTMLNWIADVNVSVIFASVGSRLLESSARTMTTQFFGNARANLESPSTAARV